MMDEFLLRALCAGLLVAAMAGTLGSVIIWRRMSYFGDTLSHSALLGVVLGLVTGLNITLGVILSSIVVAILLIIFRQKSLLQEDALLGVLAHGSLATGLVIWGSLEHANIDLFSYLFGDLLAVSRNNLLLILLVTLVVLCGYKLIYKKLLLLSINEDMAATEGVNVNQVMLGYVMLIALFVAAAMQVVGILLTTALLIIPAATARLHAQSPGTMIRSGIIWAVLAVIIGTGASLAADLVIGPAIVLTASLIFVLVFLSARNSPKT